MGVIKMNIFERSIMLWLSLLLILISLLSLMFIESYSLATQIQIVVSMVFGMLVGFYNFLVIYKRATTIIVMDIKDMKKFEKGVNKND